MSGTKIGAAKSKATILARNPNHFKEIGALGGAKAKPEDRTFYRNREVASKAGTVGGRISRRGKSKKNDNQD